MATYYVDGKTGANTNDGSSGRPWKTLSHAADSIAAGDEVRIRTATYQEQLAISQANSTWKADSGHTPIIDGGYHDGLFRSDGTLPHPNPEAGYLPSNSNGSMILLREEGITLDGLTIQNVAGAAVSTARSRFTIRNCRIDFIYDTGIRINAMQGQATGFVIENNVMTRIVQRLFDPLREGPGPEAAGAAIALVRCSDGVVRNNVIAYSMGEGIDSGKNSYRLMIEGNIVHTCNHVHLYINRAIDTTIRNNLVFHLRRTEYMGQDGKLPAGIAIGDETPKTGTWQHSAGGAIYNNVVIGLGMLFDVRNNTQNYNTQLSGCYIGYNTFIGTNETRVGIRINGNTRDRHHEESIFENNIILGGHIIGVANGNLDGVAFRNNLWSAQPVAALRGTADRIGNPNLANPAAELRGTFPSAESNVDTRNYQLTERSTLAIGQASDGSRINGLLPPTIRKDFFGGARDGQPDIGAHEYDGVGVELSSNFSLGPGQAMGVIPHTVDFTDKSTSQHPIVSRAWEFGDGGTSTETNPSHTYEATGAFDVTLTVTDDQGNSDSITQEAIVTTVEQTDIILPEEFRRFAIIQADAHVVIAYGVQYPDLRCIVVWHDQPHHLLNFADIADVERVTMTTAGAELFWFDPNDQEEALFSDAALDEELEEAEVQSMIRIMP